MAETFVGSLEKNKHADKKLHAGRGGTDKAIVVGEKGHEIKKIKAMIRTAVKSGIIFRNLE